MVADALPPLTNPKAITLAELSGLETSAVGKYLVPSDKVIGVVVAGESRAYPYAFSSGTRSSTTSLRLPDRRDVQPDLGRYRRVRSPGGRRDADLRCQRASSINRTS
jgi:hypothetical protein